MTYRSDIDGLRAIAVLAVIAFHIDAALLPGGFIGVDIFFVISGYLISKLIMEERSQGTFSLADFYERRIRRIFPALFFVVIVSGVFAALWMLPDEFDRFAKSVQANSLFLSNVHFWNEAGYFKAANEEKPLIHTWSIAIEEQFYLVFPVLLLLIARIKRLSLGLCVLVLSMLSLALAEWMSRHYFAANFYLLPGRAWEFGAGILCAVYGNQFQPKGLIRQAFSTAGLGVIIWSFVTFDSATPTPSLITLIPVAGTAMLIFFMKPGDWAARALAFGPMPAIGLLSYSLYLWHQPVFAFARIRSTSNITELGYLALVLLALGFSFLSWRFIERPFRDRSFLSRKQMFLAGALTIVGVFGLGTAAQYEPRLFGQTKEVETGLKERLRPNYGLAKGCQELPVPAPGCLHGKKPKIAVWGDSFAMHLVPGLVDHYGEQGVVQLTNPSCGPMKGIAAITQHRPSASARKCIAFNRQVERYILATPSIETVILSSAIRQYVGSGSRIVDGNEIRKSTNKRIAEAISQTASLLEANGKRALIVSPPPRDGRHYANCMRRAGKFGRESTDCAMNLQDTQDFDRDAIKVLQTVDRQHDVIWLGEYLCDDDSCRVADKDTFIYRDTGHLSFEGSVWLARQTDLWNSLKGEH